MKFRIALILLLIICVDCHSNSNKDTNRTTKINNIIAFSKLYGLVRWFHPSDEAQRIDWNKFACYGVEKVENINSTNALRDSLTRLFLPIAPSIEITDILNESVYNISNITPDYLNHYKPVYWKHCGIKLDRSPSSLYNSIRVNRLDSINYLGSFISENYFNICMYTGETVELVFEVKTKPGGECNVYFDALSQFEMSNIEKAVEPFSICNGSWKEYKILRKIKPHDIGLFLGLAGNNYYIDNIKIGLSEFNQKDSIIFENDFNSDADYEYDIHLNKLLPFDVIKVCKSNADSCLFVKYNRKFSLFSKKAQFGEIVDEQIHPSLKVSMPLVLMANENNTFPVADSSIFIFLKSKLKLNYSKKSQDIANLLISWNIMQHFYPYNMELELFWEDKLRKAIQDVFNGNDPTKTLKMMLSHLHDGHLKVMPSTYLPKFYLPIDWEWIDGTLVITRVYNDSINIKPGTIVLEIDKHKPSEYFTEIEKYISASTEGYLKELSQKESIQGIPFDTILVKIIDSSGRINEIELSFDLSASEYYSKSRSQTHYEQFGNHFFYLNLSKISKNELNNIMPSLVSSKGIICDLRGAPNNNEFLFHFMNQEFKGDCFVQLPEILYPNFQNVGFKCINKGMNIKPKAPHIDSPVVFIIDSRAISAAETAISLIKYFKLGIIVGQTTAGTNGMVNYFSLTDNTIIKFTGAKFVALDYSQHFMKGIEPDIYVEKSLKGIQQGKDEFLEKAKEILREKAEINKLHK